MKHIVEFNLPKDEHKLDDYFFSKNLLRERESFIKAIYSLIVELNDKELLTDEAHEELNDLMDNFDLRLTE